MIQKETRLKVADNSGAREILCFHLIGSTHKNFAYLGDTNCYRQRCDPWWNGKKR